MYINERHISYYNQIITKHHKCIILKITLLCKKMLLKQLSNVKMNRPLTSNSLAVFSILYLIPNSSKNSERFSVSLKNSSKLTFLLLMINCTCIQFTFKLLLNSSICISMYALSFDLTSSKQFLLLHISGNLSYTGQSTDHDVSYVSFPLHVNKSSL